MLIGDSLSVTRSEHLCAIRSVPRESGSISTSISMSMSMRMSETTMLSSGTLAAKWSSGKFGMGTPEVP
jgi:hypothetical protein